MIETVPLIVRTIGEGGMSGQGPTYALLPDRMTYSRFQPKPSPLR